MRIVLIGARGMLGSDLANVFAGDELSAWDRDDIDITDADQISEKISEISPEFLINAAAFTDVDAAESDKEAAFAVNERGVANLAAAAKECGATLVHYSTNYVFNGQYERGYSEEDTPSNPVNVYGESKLAGEEALRQSGAQYVLIRTAWLYGSIAEPAHHKNFVESILRLANEKDELGIVDDQHGNPTLTRDVAEATKRLLEPDGADGTYHFVNEGTTTWFELAKEIVARAGLQCDVKPIATHEYSLPAARPTHSALLNTKVPKLRSWKEALAVYMGARSSQ